MKKNIIRLICIFIVLGAVYGLGNFRGYMRAYEDYNRDISESEREYRDLRSDCLQSGGSFKVCETTSYRMTLEKYYPEYMEEYIIYMKDQNGL